MQFTLFCATYLNKDKLTYLQNKSRKLTERLVLASAPYAPHESFYHQWQKYTISNLSGVYLEGAFAPLF